MCVAGGEAMDEQQRVASLSEWYLKDQLAFDKQLIGFRFETLRPYLNDGDGLELGPADGHMTRLLLNHFATLTVVDGSSDLLDRIPESEGLFKVHSLFEHYVPERAFSTVVMEHILEHVEDPVALLRQARSSWPQAVAFWLAYRTATPFIGWQP